MLPASVQARICGERRSPGHRPRPIAARLGRPHATIWKTLRRAGCPPPEAKPRETSSDQKRRGKLGYDVVHAIVDDHSRDRYYRQRPHSSLRGRSPISRVRNVCRQDR